MHKTEILFLKQFSIMYSPDYIKFKKKLTEAQKLLDQNILPSNAQHNELYNWMQGHFSRFKKKKLPPVKVNDVKHLLEQVIKLKEDISLGLVKGSSPVETKWEQKFELLKQFRQKNPRRWPLSTAADPEEKKLGIWCQDLRTRYRNEKLGPHWIDKLNSIDFNFDGRIYSWMQRFQKLKEYIETNNCKPGTTHEIYDWTRQQYKRFNILSPEKQSLLSETEFMKFTFSQKPLQKPPAKK